MHVHTNVKALFFYRVLFSKQNTESIGGIIRGAKDHEVNSKSTFQLQ